MTLGVFDSGIGGLTALYALHRTLPYVDCLYYADRANAPYGNKTEEELTSLVTKDVEKLRRAGADRILIACCTASTVYRNLPAEDRKIVLPIIRPTADAALALTKNKRIGLICTDATARSGTFANYILQFDNTVKLFTLPTQNFVFLVERGVSDVSMTADDFSVINNTLAPLLDTGIDTLILGCTHFSYLRKTVETILPNVKTVCSALCGAEAMVKSICGQSLPSEREGALTYLD